MSLLNPWLLLGLSAVAVPVLLHLVARAERDGRAFPSLMFVRRVAVPMRRRRELRDRRLLALRILALVLLALAFAGPQLPPPPLAVAGNEIRRDTVLLIDRSYSMAPAARREALAAALDRHLDALPAGERMALVGFAGQAWVLAPLQADTRVLSQIVADLQPADGPTRLGPALDLAAGLLRESPAQARRVVLISDLQRSALDRAEALVLDAGIELVIEPVAPDVRRNLAVLDAALVEADATGQVLDISLLNSGVESIDEALVSVESEGRTLVDARVSLAAGASTRLRLPVVAARDRPIPLRVTLPPDDLTADDRFDLVLMPSAPLAVGLLSSAGDAADAEVFIRSAAALADDPPLQLRGLVAGPGLESDLRGLPVVLAESAAVRDRDSLRILTGFVEAGGGLLLFETAPRGRLSAQEDATITIPNGWMEYPAPGIGFSLAPMSPGQSGVGDPWGGERRALGAALAGVRVWQAAELAGRPGQRVLASLDDGRPWLIERPLGQGLLLHAATGLRPPQSNLALEPGFPPLLQRLVRYLANRPAAPLAYRVGEGVDLYAPVAALSGAADWRAYLASGGRLLVELPDGGYRQLAPGERWFRASAPGQYQVHRADGGAPSARFAVNHPRTESRLEAARVDELQQHLIRRAPSGPADIGASGTAREPFGLGWSLLLAAALLFGLESLLANRLSWQRQQARGRAGDGMAIEGW